MMYKALGIDVAGRYTRRRRSAPAAVKTSKKHGDADIGDAVLDIDRTGPAGDGDDRDDAGGDGLLDGHVHEDGQYGDDDDSAAESADGPDDPADES